MPLVFELDDAARCTLAVSIVVGGPETLMSAESTAARGMLAVAETCTGSYLCMDRRIHIPAATPPQAALLRGAPRDALHHQSDQPFRRLAYPA